MISLSRKNFWWYGLAFGCLSIWACSDPGPSEGETQISTCTCEAPAGSGQPRVRGAMMASRFASLEDLKKAICIEYFPTETDSAGEIAGAVRVRHCSDGQEVVSYLEAGVSEGDFSKARDGSAWDQMLLGLDAPFAVGNRDDLQRVYLLSRRRPGIFGEGDVAFFDLAEQTVKHINTPETAFVTPRDSSEKGFLNTFNHMTAQAFITLIFSEEMADFVADVHERHHMPELITGNFSPEQLAHPDKNPVDNYVDIVNNEWGQEMGKQLRERYGISRETTWTPELLAQCLNETQAYYSWALQIGLEPFRPEDEVVRLFAEKINLVMAENIPAESGE